MSFLRYCLNSPKWLASFWPHGELRHLKLLPLILLSWLVLVASLCACQAPIRCRPNAQMIEKQARLATNGYMYMYGIKCKETLK